MFGRNKGTLFTAVVVGTVLIIFFAHKSKWPDYDAVFLLTSSCPEARLPQACRFAGFMTVHPDFPLWGVKYSRIMTKTPLDYANKSEATNSMSNVKNHNFACSSHSAFLVVYATHERNDTPTSTKGNFLLKHEPSGLIGLPGGEIASGETISDGLTRLLSAELNVKQAKLPARQHLGSYMNAQEDKCVHLFASKIKHSELKQLLLSALVSPSFGLVNGGYSLLPISATSGATNISALSRYLAFGLSPTTPYVDMACSPRAVSVLRGNTFQLLHTALLTPQLGPILTPAEYTEELKAACSLVSNAANYQARELDVSHRDRSNRPPLQV
ncbi:hypothetical protein AAHC03_025769 [Spirometra sp. Aus1]